MPQQLSEGIDESNQVTMPQQLLPIYEPKQIIQPNQPLTVRASYTFDIVDTFEDCICQKKNLSRGCIASLYKKGIKETLRMLSNTVETLMQFPGDYAARTETFRKQLDEVYCDIWCNKETQNSEAEMKEGFEVFSEKLDSPEGRFLKDRKVIHQYYLEVEEYIIHEDYSFYQLEDNLSLLENFEDYLAITQPVVKICINDSWSVSIDNTIDNVFKNLTLAVVTLEELSPEGEILSRQTLTPENLISIPKPQLRE